MAKITKEKSKKMAEELLMKPKHSADVDRSLVAKAEQFSIRYKEFLDAGKTEREAVVAAQKLLEAAGYKPMQPGKKYKAGEKAYQIIQNKAIIAFTVGEKNVANGVRITAAHIDSPRLDLKPKPLYESEELGFFKTHYYGGIRKYQWVAIPLSMHGVVIKKNGESVEIRIGEDAGDPVFTITDLLPHLSADQNKRSLPEGIKGEELNILIGSIPFEDEDAKERVKLEIMRLLNEKYGITEHDFLRAEIEFVPAMKASDVGFDRSLIGAYGQDDRVCAYTALMAEMETKAPVHTSICVLADKEETGSNGITGLASDFLMLFLQDLAEVQEAPYRNMIRASICLSADVTAAMDPTFPEVLDKRNATHINYGAAIAKYTGSRGKNGTTDASAELMGYVTNLLDREKVCWQTGELGKVDQGGGGTVAVYIANRNIPVVDIGVPVLSMHAPFEITGKLDVYSTYKAFSAFINDK